MKNDSINIHVFWESLFELIDVKRKALRPTQMPVTP